ncbi:MAG: NAD-dependent epimerase/dehydratase family protein [Candidatus Diapherotrites archaeon]|nr:NAD-dependent epimerase/dehydratase family protein [Candidatus Diapherotrites archaeon]
MRILVTGSSGFIGKRLVHALKKTGAQVHEFDIALGNDLLDREECSKAVQGIDIVFHLAAVLEENSPMLHKVNVIGTQNIAEASAQARAKQFVFLSSVGVHGKSKEIVNEKSPIHPETEYEKTKAEAEQIILEFQEMMPITIIRSALVLGANSQWSGIVKIIKKDFPIPGNGKNTFQTIFVDDLVSALVFTVNNEKCFGETFIAAGNEKPSLGELVAIVRKELGMKGKTKTFPSSIAKTFAGLNSLKNKLRGKNSFFEPVYINRILHERNYDTQKILEIGWKPKTSLEDAIKKTLEGLNAV